MARSCAVCERTLLLGERSTRFTPDGETFVDVCQLCQDIDRLERSEIHSFQYRRYVEAFPWLGLASLGLGWGLRLGSELVLVLSLELRKAPAGKCEARFVVREHCRSLE